MPISNTIVEFREAVLKKGGPQIASKYRVTLTDYAANSLLCYPLAVIIPGRNFSFYEHDIWGPIRRIPNKRGYTQCNMTFLVYQDWTERKFLETWMNEIVYDNYPVPFSNTLTEPPQSSNFDDFLSNRFSGLAESVSPVFTENFSEALSIGNVKDSVSSGKYKDYINYKGGIGQVMIECLSSNSNDQVTSSFVLEECFPSQISPTSLASDGTGYPSFTVSFQYNTYYQY
jgi:hypothetical protein